jgi:hypothetical protein
MTAKHLVKELLWLVVRYGDCDIEVEIKTPTALDPTFQAVASEPRSVVHEDRGNKMVVSIRDWE